MSVKDSRKRLRAAHASARNKLEEMLAKIDRAEYRQLLDEMRALYQPASPLEENAVKRMAMVTCQLHACLPIETRIWHEGMEACKVEGDSPNQAMVRAFLRDIEGPDLLAKLSRYESRLQSSFTECLRLLERRGAIRRRDAQAANARLAKLAPCTSVVQ